MGEHAGDSRNPARNRISKHWLTYHYRATEGSLCMQAVAGSYCVHSMQKPTGMLDAIAGAPTAGRPIRLLPFE